MSRSERKRDPIAGEDGFTLTEMLAALAVIGVLTALAVPSYLGFRERGHETAAAVLVRNAVPAIEVYKAENGTYAGMSLAALSAIDPTITVSVDAASLGAASYCISATQGGFTFSKTNPGGQIVSGGC